MQFRKFLHWSRRTFFPRSVAPFIGITNLMGLIGLYQLQKTAKLRQAMETRQLTGILGVPPVPKADDMMAGNNIKIGSNPAWIIGAMLLGAALFWFVTRPQQQQQKEGVQLPQTKWSAQPFDPFNQ